MVTTNDDEISGLVRMLLKHGGKDKYNVDHIGYNARLDTLHAAVLKAKLQFIDEFNEKRNAIAEKYSTGLSGVKGLSLPVNSSAGSYHVYHQYTVQTPKRDELQGYLREKGVSTMVYYPFPLHKMKVFHGRMKTYGTLANSERATEEVLSLPIEPLQTSENTAYIVDCIKEFFLR
jgi:dTDP-4-amino-4,6-dideoxygalactose transaminase